MEYVMHEGGDVSEFRYTADEARSRAKDPIQATQSTKREASVERAAVVSSTVAVTKEWIRVDVADGVSERETVRSWCN